MGHRKGPFLDQNQEELNRKKSKMLIIKNNKKKIVRHLNINGHTNVPKSLLHYGYLDIY
jgi:hypothetical protein